MYICVMDTHICIYQSTLCVGVGVGVCVGVGVGVGGCVCVCACVCVCLPAGCSSAREPVASGSANQRGVQRSWALSSCTGHGLAERRLRKVSIMCITTPCIVFLIFMCVQKV